MKKPTVKFRLCLPALEDAYLDEMTGRGSLELERSVRYVFSDFVDHVNCTTTTKRFDNINKHISTHWLLLAASTILPITLLAFLHVLLLLGLDHLVELLLRLLLHATNVIHSQSIPFVHHADQLTHGAGEHLDLLRTDDVLNEGLQSEILEDGC